MPSAFENIFDENLINICFDNNFKDLNCILGATEIFMSIIFITLIILGLVKLLRYYGNMNFETSLLLFSIIQIILLDIIIIMPYDFLFECFFFVQICHISLTIRKFIIILKSEKTSLNENLIFIILNTINIIIFTLYILSLLDICLNNIYIYIQSSLRIYYFITSIILSFLCRNLIIKVKNYENKNESYELSLKNKDSNLSRNSGLILSFHNNEWVYFLIRERQILPLYILNLICSFIQMLFVLSKNFLLEDFFQKDEYKLISLKNSAYIIYYNYLIICFLNVLVNYFCFYWIVKEQYDDNNDKITKLKKNDKRKILDEKFIERETAHNKEEEKEMEILMDEKIKDKKELIDSIYSNTFTENIDENEQDKDENYFVKEKEGDKKNVEMTEPSYVGMSGRGTMVSNNPINQSTVNNNIFLENFENNEYY